MQYKWLLFILYFSCTIQAFSSVTSIRSSLSKRDFIKSKGMLDKESMRDSNNYAYDYLRALYYFDASNKEKNSFMALESVHRCALKYQANNDAKLLLANDKYGINSAQINALYHQLELEIYYQSRVENSIESFELALTYPLMDTMLVHDIRRMRDELAFKKANNTNDFLSFKEFMEKYPNANQAGLAKENYEKLLFKTATDIHTWQAYKNYIDQYPKAQFLNEAKEQYELLLYDDFIKSNNISKIYSYIINYPSAKYLREAEKVLFETTCSNLSNEQLIRFITNYPKCTQSVQRAWDYLYLYSTADDQPASYRQFIQQYPDYYNADRFKADSSQSDWRLSVFEKDGKFGIAKDDSIVVIEPIYQELSSFSGKHATVGLDCKDGKCMYSFINKRGQIHLGTFNEVYDFALGAAIVGVGDCPVDDCKYGLISENGDTIVPLTFDFINEASNSLFLACQRLGPYGFLNARGDTVIPFIYFKARDFSDSVALVAMRDSSYFFIDLQGKKLDSLPKFSLATDFVDGFSSFSTNGQTWGVFNKKGQIIHPDVYKEPIHFVEGKAIAKREDAITRKSKTTYKLNTYELRMDGSFSILK